MLDVARTLTASTSMHALAGSSRPGAVPPLVTLGATAAPEMAGMVAGAVTRGHPDAAVIDLAGRVVALAERERALWERRSDVEGQVDEASPPRPISPADLQPLSYRIATVDGERTTTIVEPAGWAEALRTAKAAHAAALAEHERLVAEIGARLGLPRWEKLADRASARLARWGGRLATLAPRTQTGLKAKVEASMICTKGEVHSFSDWRKDLTTSISADALRIIGAETDARAEQDRQVDGGLLALGRAWDIAHGLFREASEREDRAHVRFLAMTPSVPEELFRTDTDHRHVGPYGSVHGGTGRRWYGSPDTIEALRQGCPSTLDEGRRQEILDAHDRWRAEIKAASAACGLEAILDEIDLLGEREFELRSRIVSTPALTPEGVRVKVRVAYSLADKWDDAFIQKIASGVKEEVIPTELVALSLVLDLARMGCGAVPVTLPTADVASAA